MHESNVSRSPSLSFSRSPVFNYPRVTYLCNKRKLTLDGGCIFSSFLFAFAFQSFSFSFSSFFMNKRDTLHACIV
ncbi:hypothetical protein CSUI_000610 [Cystoisospora suis]|uniref:Transmembrane protein n=1 Tax=Cystoisospora suis TaxID=483139 RepID=A0A2C6LFV3_9APIC|nr:hypothetical protein CSUI_000610 [Cystoisospora suis]